MVSNKSITSPKDVPMPRPRFSNRLVADTFTIPAASVVAVDIDLQDSFYPQLMIKVDYPVTGNPAGVTCVLYAGFVVDNLQNVEYVDNSSTVAEMQNPIPNTATPQTKRSGFAVNPEVFPRFLRLRLTNTDTVNAVTVRIVGDW